MPTTRVEVQFDRAKLEALKKTYAENAHLHRDDVFMFEGMQFVKGYAKYLIEYLEERLKK